MSNATIDWLNGLPEDEARDALLRVCGSDWWCEQVTAARPFASEAELLAAAGAAFSHMPREAWLEAFAAHPMIGDVESLRMKFAGNREWSAGEQAGVDGADDRVLERLAAGNHAYRDRFGYIFIVCASGKSAAEMLALLESRLDNDEDTELGIASGEQQKITYLRLAKLTPDETPT